MPTLSAQVAVVFGTRPEAIKLAPVVSAMRRARFPHFVITTGQHASIVSDVLELFAIEPDTDLELMEPGQGLDQLLAGAIERVGQALDERNPSAVIVQGDTSSMLGSALASFHRGIPVAHVEAGLRSHDPRSPFPEEMNRRLASTIATWHFAPTAGASENLRREGIVGGIHVVGNTVVDALRRIRSEATPLPSRISAFVESSPYLLATAHRRESWDGGIEAIALALRDVLLATPGLRLVFVTHPNPVARGPVDVILGGEPRALVVDALPYQAFLTLLANARLAVSDSGGVQEEAPTLGVPLLVTRETTERPEGVHAGAVRLVGTGADRVRSSTLELLRNPAQMAAMARAGHGLYGDGAAAERIVTVLARELLSA